MRTTRIKASSFKLTTKHFKHVVLLSSRMNVKKKARLQISAGHRTFVRQIWGFDRETAQSDLTPWRASPVKMVISLKKANFNILLWWITATFSFDLCLLKVFVSLNWKHVTTINIHAVRTSKVACTVYWNWFKFKKRRVVTIVVF